MIVLVQKLIQFGLTYFHSPPKNYRLHVSTHPHNRSYVSKIKVLLLRKISIDIQMAKKIQTKQLIVNVLIQ